MFQVGYHPRGGVEGFLSHTIVPGLRLRVDGELISESHCRAWASGVPLLGITGNDLHQQTIGSLSDTPYLVVQKSLGRSAMQPIWNVEEGLEAIREFAERCMRDAASAPPVRTPRDGLFEASMPNGHEVVEQMDAAGWARTGDVTFEVHLETWADAREPLAAAMSAALAPFIPYWLGGFDSAEARGGGRPGTRRATEADLRRLGAGVPTAMVGRARRPAPTRRRAGTRRSLTSAAWPPSSTVSPSAAAMAYWTGATTGAWSRGSSTTDTSSSERRSTSEISCSNRFPKRSRCHSALRST